MIDYVRNPEKTTQDGYDELASLHLIDGVMEYVADDMKTEQRSYVSCLNCQEDAAAAQFMETKRMWGKQDGRMCYHGYQSFKEGEVTADIAHEIGVKLAQELWGDRFEVMVATHCNTGHYHNHFVINSVSFVDGYKFYNFPADYAKMRAVSDRLCREHAISVIEHPSGRARNYGEWQAEKNGKPTYRGTIRADIDRAILASTTERDFLHVMTQMGYEFKTRGKNGQPLKYPALKPPDAKGYFRLHKLGEGYSLEEIKRRILQNLRKQVPFSETTHKPPRHYCVRGKPRKKLTGIRALYFRYCYELHIIVKRPASVKRVSFLLREDLTKLKRLDAEVRFLGKYRISAMAELSSHRDKAIAEIATLTSQRQELRRQLKIYTRQGNTNAADEVKSEIKMLSQRLKLLRKETALCNDIADRSGQVAENLKQLLEDKQNNRKERDQNELFGRCSRTGRAHDNGR